MRVAGIDCGMSGHVSIIGDGKYVGGFRMPIKKSHKGSIIDGRKFLALLQLLEPDHCYVEQQFSVQGQAGGAKTMFNYGYLCGLMTAANLSFTVVPAQKWQKKIFGGKVEDTKQASIASVITYDPKIDVRKSDRSTVASADKCDSINIARFGYLEKTQ